MSLFDIIGRSVGVEMEDVCRKIDFLVGNVGDFQELVVAAAFGVFRNHQCGRVSFRDYRLFAAFMRDVVCRLIRAASLRRAFELTAERRQSKDVVHFKAEFIERAVVSVVLLGSGKAVDVD